MDYNTIQWPSIDSIGDRLNRHPPRRAAAPGGGTGARPAFAALPPLACHRPSSGGMIKAKISTAFRNATSLSCLIEKGQPRPASGGQALRTHPHSETHHTQRTTPAAARRRLPRSRT